MAHEDGLAGSGRSGDDEFGAWPDGGVDVEGFGGTGRVGDFEGDEYGAQVQGALGAEGNLEFAVAFDDESGIFLKGKAVEPGNSGEEIEDLPACEIDEFAEAVFEALEEDDGDDQDSGDDPAGFGLPIGPFRLGVLPVVDVEEFLPRDSGGIRIVEVEDQLAVFAGAALGVGVGALTHIVQDAVAGGGKLGEADEVNEEIDEHQ